MREEERGPRSRVRAPSLTDPRCAGLDGSACAELVEKVRQATNLRRAHIGLGGIVLVILFIFFGFGAAFLTNLIALSFPVWASFKAIESVNAEDDKQWLMYWIIFGFVTLLESFVEFIVRYVPFYYSLKGAFFIYLQLPQFYVRRGRRGRNGRGSRGARESGGENASRRPLVCLCATRTDRRARRWCTTACLRRT